MKDKVSLSFYKRDSGDRIIPPPSPNMMFSCGRMSLLGKRRDKKWPPGFLEGGGRESIMQRARACGKESGAKHKERGFQRR